MAAKFPTLPFLVTTHWRVYGAGIALVGSILGALYPAWKAPAKTHRRPGLRIAIVAN